MSEKEREYIHFIEDIANTIKKIERYTKDLEFEEFSENEMAVDAVIRNFEVIGEAVNNIPDKERGRILQCNICGFLHPDTRFPVIPIFLASALRESSPGIRTGCAG
jgi:hypothetical protein